MVRRFPILCAAALAASALFAQFPSPQVLPNDPEQFLALAHAHNDIDIAGVSPWELKATFQLFNEQGALVQTLALDELWAGPEQQRQTWSGPYYHRTTVTNHDGTFRTGDQQPVPPLVGSALSLLVHPVPDPSETSATTLEMQAQRFGRARFNCAISIPAEPPPQMTPIHVLLIPRPIEYCFALDTLTYQFTLKSGSKSESDSGLAFQGRNVAQHDAIVVGKVVRSKGTVDNLSLLPQPDPKSFIPAPDAIRLDATAPTR